MKRGELSASQIGVNRLFRKYKLDSKKRNVHFELSKEILDNLVKSNCTYCGSPPSNFLARKSGEGFAYNGIDRVDNNAGYTISNSVTCCKDCNFAKRFRTREQFLDWAKKLYEYQKLDLLHD